MERSLKTCQDRMLDVLGPLAKIIDAAEESHINGSPLNTDTIRGWSQRALVLLGNANSSLNAERRRVVLSNISPKLSDLADKEPSSNPRGMLFGEDLIKTLSKYVSTFTALDKAHQNMRKVFNPNNLFGRAGRRGQSSGRFSRRPFPRSAGYSGRGFQPPTAPQFYPPKGRGFRARGFRSRGTNIDATSHSEYLSFPKFSLFFPQSGRQIKTFRTKLETDNPGSLGSQYSEWFHDRLHRDPNTTHSFVVPP